MLILVSGAPASGKTAALRRALELLAERGLKLRACLSVATERVPEGPALGFDLALLEAGGTERPFLAERSRSPLARRPSPAPGDGPVRERLAPFVFHARAFAEAAAFLSGDAAGRRLTAVDEVGPLELEGGGFFPALRSWAEGVLPGSLAATVRPSLAGRLAEILGAHESGVVDVTGLSVQEAARRIILPVDSA